MIDIRLTTQDGIAWLQIENLAIEADAKTLSLWLRTASEWLAKPERFSPSTDFCLDGRIVEADPLTDHASVDEGGEFL